MDTSISTITLFAEDLVATKAFYLTVFDLPVHYEDDDSCVFDFGNTLINLLRVENAPEVVAPASIGIPHTTRSLITITVADVDEAADDLAAKGVEVLNGPIDRPWGVRTVAFQDPTGVVWEFAQPL